MQCAEFNDNITEYLDCNLTRMMRREFCEHLLACRDCHGVFNDVRETINVCNQLNATEAKDGDVLVEMQQRIIGATHAGEMLSCLTLDALISDYFDGLIESSYEQVFNEHFAVCGRCRRLVEGVRLSIEEQESVEVPGDLDARIFAATYRAVS